MSLEPVRWFIAPEKLSWVSPHVCLVWPLS